MKEDQTRDKTGRVMLCPSCGHTAEVVALGQHPIRRMCVYEGVVSLTYRDYYFCKECGKSLIAKTRLTMPFDRNDDGRPVMPEWRLRR